MRCDLTQGVKAVDHLMLNIQAALFRVEIGKQACILKGCFRCIPEPGFPLFVRMHFAVQRTVKCIRVSLCPNVWPSL